MGLGLLAIGIFVLLWWSGILPLPGGLDSAVRVTGRNPFHLSVLAAHGTGGTAGEDLRKGNVLQRTITGLLQANRIAGFPIISIDGQTPILFWDISDNGQTRRFSFAWLENEEHIQQMKQQLRHRHQRPIVPKNPPKADGERLGRMTSKKKLPLLVLPLGELETETKNEKRLLLHVF